MSNNLVKGAIIFVAGVGIGVFSTMKFFELKYKKISDAEIESVKNRYSVPKPFGEFVPECLEKELESMADAATAATKALDDYKSCVTNLGYSTGEGGAEMEREPYVITPEEFGEIPDYDTTTLSYFRDGVLVDQNGEVLDIFNTVGTDALDHIGDFEEDTVHVRDDVARVDYEITLAEGAYATTQRQALRTVDDE